jgi:hypothetical protein
VLIATSKCPPCGRKFAHLAAAAAGPRGLWAPASGAARPLAPPGARGFQRFFKALEAPKPLEPTGLPPWTFTPPLCIKYKPGDVLGFVVRGTSTAASVNTGSCAFYVQFVCDEIGEPGCFY